jgi:hypothetical protein
MQQVAVARMEQSNGVRSRNEASTKKGAGQTGNLISTNIGVVLLTSKCTVQKLILLLRAYYIPLNILKINFLYSINIIKINGFRYN